MAAVALTATLSGRADEQVRLLDSVRTGLEGRPQATLLHGEAGIGKTILVRAVCEQVRAEGAQVLWGQSLRFGTIEAMYHPLVLALEAWLAQVDDPDRSSVLDAVPGASLILPSLGAVPTQGQSQLLTVVDALLGRVIARRPTLLVVDDVQWADPATWDALSYLVAGFTRQRLAVVTTHRDEGVGAESFQRWLANLRRLPGAQEMSLGRLDQASTGEQLAVLLGATPTPRLLQQVHERSRGNPYFNELLVRRGDLGSSELPEDLPDELSQALLDNWRTLSTPAREITRVLAIGGRPSALATLTGVAEGLGITTAGALHEAVNAGVVVLDGDEVWFRHPLLAGVLTESYLPGEAAPVHSAWAVQLAGGTSDGVDELRRLGDLASHHERAGEGSAAFSAMLLGADLAEELGAWREAVDLLVRACHLWHRGPHASDPVVHARLLDRAGRGCLWVGRSGDAHRLLSAALDIVALEGDVLWSSAMTLRLADATKQLGGTVESVRQVIARAVELSRDHPDSPEYAEALTTLCDHSWTDDGQEARQAIDDAVSAALRSGSPRAIAGALAIRSLRLARTDLEKAREDSATAWQHATASQDREALALAFVDRSAFLELQGDFRAVRALAPDLYEHLSSQGMRVYASIELTRVLLATGELVKADEAVRAGLAAPGAPFAEAGIRILAALLATYRGLDVAALDHLDRAQEIQPDRETLEWTAGPQLPRLLLARGAPAAAFALVERTLALPADLSERDELMVLAAGATADLVQQAEDQRDTTGVQRHRDALARLVAERRELPGVPFVRTGDSDTVQVAQAALFAAEHDRALGRADQVGLWGVAAAACETAGLGWQQQQASWRLAAALLASGARGPEVGEVLRDVHAYAVRERAAPLARRVEELAAAVRISLTPSFAAPGPAAPRAFAGLTARETEVLTHLVGNRTNAEIAAELFISEKTVSVHVSNLLRKTDTTSRREVASLARRLGWGADPQS